MIQISNNERLRAIVSLSGLSTAVALTIFNRGLGVNACPSSVWAAYLSDPGAPHHRELDAELLSHAEARFATVAS